MLNLSLLRLFFMMLVDLVLVHMTNVQVYVNFKQNICMILSIVAGLSLCKENKAGFMSGCVNHLDKAAL